MLPVPDAGRRTYLALVAAVLATAAAAWTLIARWMPGMDEGPGTYAADFGLFAAVWVAMVAAMMLPVAAPMVGTYSALRRSVATLPRACAGGAAFLAGYVLVWALAGLAAYAAVEAVRGVAADALAWDRGGRYAAGALLVFAAAYQQTPVKDRCLAQCRVPLAFMLSSWRAGDGGAFRMGVGFGGWCVACCWALIAALFALGAMSVVWMAVVGALIAVERLAPGRTWASTAVAVVLLVLGVAVGLAPESVPALTMPG